MFKKLSIEGTRKTPTVLLDPEGIISIHGRSIPEDASIFFREVMEWIDMYLTVPQDQTRIDIALEYLNSGTSKYVLQLLKKLRDLNHNGHKLIVNWYYEEGDDDILERGEYYSSILDLKINYIETE